MNREIILMRHGQPVPNERAGLMSGATPLPKSSKATMPLLIALSA